ncbi:hypothetical protein ACGC1H_002064 [Rhizoctonia solani]
MLGRLRMPVESAIKSYANLAKDVFSEKKRYGSGSFKTTRLKESLRDIIQNATLKGVDEAKELLKDLGHFALAVVHAGSFIGQTPHMSIAEYRSLLMRQKRQALEAYSKLPQAAKVDDYGHTVYTAWRMCYEQLSSRAQELLWLFALLHHTGVTVDIFRRAAENIGSYKPTFPSTPVEDLALQQLRNFLCGFLNSSQNWDGLLFAVTVNEISSHSLLEYDALNQAYRTHVLVQGWVHIVVAHDVDISTECARILLAVSIPLDESWESTSYRINIGPHIDKILSEASVTVGPNHAEPFYQVLKDRGQWIKAELLNTGIQEIIKPLGKDHPNTLIIMNNLASTYSELGRYEDARALHLQALDKRKQVLGNDHPDTLKSMNNLANTDYGLGRYEAARAVYSQVLYIRQQVLGNDHPDTLKSINNLALTYSKLGRFEDARGLHAQVLGVRKQVLGIDHPDTLKSMNSLALAYSGLGRFEDARALHSQVLDTRKQVLGIDHPDTLTSMNNLALAYSNLGRFEDARILHSQVLDARKQVLGKGHPNTLGSMNNLALTLSGLGRFEEARALHSQVLDARKQVLGNEHPDTLKSILYLAALHIKLDQVEEAEKLQGTLDKYIRVFGENHEWTNYARGQIEEVHKYRNKPAGGSSWCHVHLH